MLKKEEKKIRNRKQKSPEAAGNRQPKPSKTNKHGQLPRDSVSTSSERNNWHTSLFYNLVVVVSVAAVAVIAYVGFKSTRVNTPFSHDKLVDWSKLDKQEYYWGTYRPGLYFGTKTRVPYSLVTGMMWYPQDMWLLGLEPRMRHWCDQNDNLERYGWLKHDGKNFGVQEIVDKGTLIRTSFIKNIHGNNGGDWTAHINVTEIKPLPQQKRRITLLYYAAIENRTMGEIKPTIDQVIDGKYSESRLVSIDGRTEELGFFKINFSTLKGKDVQYSYLSTYASSLSELTETVLHGLRSVKGSIILPGEARNPVNNQENNLIVTHITADLPLELEVSFERESQNRKEKITGDNFNKMLETHEKEFDDKFERIFKLKEKGFSNARIKFAKLAFSNMIGSVGYFYGSPQVQSEHTQKPVPYWKAPLFTGVPSRSFFPRGFLWDEGFHGMLLSHWNLDLEMDIISHWFDLMNVEGWIPREMILGDEALAKVPEEFVVQFNANANPPTFLMTLNYILEHRREEFQTRHLDLLEKLYPRLQAWYDWYNTTQKGEQPSSYRWRGRNPNTNKELNPKTLTSGLDDYPRASHPSKDERHVDLRCWMAMASKVMATVSDILQKPSQKYMDTYEYLADNRLLNELHWSSRAERYSDFGLHTDKIQMKKIKKINRNNQETFETIREQLEDPKEQFVDSNFGYVSLFPFILRLVEPDSPQLQKILQDLKNPDLLWTDMGLRSLAKSSPIYNKYNTEHDPPYWRGPIWINMNYLTVAALHHYSMVDGPYQAKARMIYSQLRKNLIDNIFKQYKRTGYIWENYGDNEGEGKGSHPFTGWSSLVVLIMAELY
ncbi:mannosyl-oligosaccharide glucosidase GCS1-like [Copidosoma floridanum]|uniref:mannosyl-oligosaccharide glucosidase GCS1-like n=1 Tax=Copidosoma floridanum TaxID=29053 RepID=UPI0006C962B6|nr:mannosyl-oligosaccharide glucosidase GCS1-like [Copidosoma floridanum]